MNILIISSLLPYPLNSGGAQAQYNMIDYLRQFHHITFLYTEDGHNTKKNKDILQDRWKDVTFLSYSYIKQLRHLPFLCDKAERAFKLAFIPENNHFKIQRILKPYGVYFSQHFVSFVRRTIQETKAEVVQVDFYPCMGIVRYLPQTIKTVFIQHEIRFVRNQRYLDNYKLNEQESALQAQVYADEIACMNQYHQVITLTETDKQILQQHGVTQPIAVSPAGINTALSPYCERSGQIFFIGACRHIPNQQGVQWFIHEVAQHIPSTLALSLNIIGSGWNEKFSTNHIQVKNKGFVNDLSQCTSGGLMIVPILSGSGMRMKILEAAALCLPIVTTTVGVEGLDFIHEHSCLIADTPEEFAQAIVRLETDLLLRKRLAQQAQAVFIEKYSIESLGKLREQILLHVQ